MNDDECFQVGDEITIGNADRPAWAGGLWRVERVERDSVKLLPLKDDHTVDVPRAHAREYWISRESR